MNKTKINIDEIIKEFKKFVLKYKKKSARDCQVNAIRALYGGVHHPHFLFNMCCGAGKTIIEAFLVYKEIIDCEKNNKFARIMVASHRLLLNNQLIEIINTALEANKIKNVNWYNLSSASIKINGVNVASFKKTTIDTVNTDKNHVIIIACAASQKKYFDSKNNANMLEDMMMKELEENTQMIVDNTNKNENDYFFNLIVQDEIHKDIPAKILDNFDKISSKVYGFSATPSRKNVEWFGIDNVFEYGFAKALEDNIVVKGKLYISKPNAKKWKKKEATNLIECFEHLKKKCEKMELIPVFLNYFSSVDGLTEYAQTIIKKYGNNVDVAVFASYKEIKDEKGATKIKIQCELNGEVKTQKELLKYCQDRNDNSKPLIILSAFMIVEGIDIPSINGVGIWCEKNDANMFQAACRGCRIDSKKKTHFYIYTSEYLVTESKEFLTKLYNGFNGELDFGDGQEDCKGNGKNDDKSRMKNTQDGFVVVPASSINTATAIIKEVQIEYEREIEEKNIEKNYMEIEKQVLTCKNYCEAIMKMIEFRMNPAFDGDRLQNVINEHEW